MPWRRKHEAERASQAALIDATKGLQQAKSMTPEVLEVSRALRQLRERNHFAEKLQHIMGGSPL